jgi:hypothetical protein
VKRPMVLMLKTRDGREWAFNFDGDPRYLPEWRDAGLEIHEVVARIPTWAADLGLARLWAAAQAGWQWMRLW